MYSKEEILAYHCPRWEELPDIELYMDQVLGFIEKNTAVFAENDEQVSLTKTMINNYVKQKKVKPPINKKYNKNHIATFMVVGIMKRYLGLSELGEGILKAREVYSEKDAYNLFCEILENSLQCVFTGRTPEYPLADGSPEAELYISLTGAFAYMLYSRYILDLLQSKNKEKSSENTNNQ